MKGRNQGSLSEGNLSLHSVVDQIDQDKKKTVKKKKKKSLKKKTKKKRNGLDSATPSSLVGNREQLDERSIDDKNRILTDLINKFHALLESQNLTNDDQTEDGNER